MVNTPIPHSLRSEVKKAAKILRDFTVPSAKSGPDKLIPGGIIGNAKGLAILTVVKLGFLVTARGGSGIVIAKLDDGTWSAPSAIGLAGLGGGFEIGAEVTDFVIILNSKSAVDAFSKGGNLTLGGNFTVAVGPLGRNIEGDVVVRSPAAIYTYSKTKGIFAGISIEGSGLIERKDANKKFYKEDVRAYSILSGEVSRPPECADLYDVLEKHDVFAEKAVSEMRQKRDAKIERDQLKHQDIRREQTTVISNRMKTLTSKERTGASVTTKTTRTITRTVSSSDSNSLSRSQSMSIPSASLHLAPADTVTAIHDFEGQMPCDLSFRKADTIAVLLRTDTQNDWWEGKVHGKTGIFPANYAEVHW